MSVKTCRITQAYSIPGDIGPLAAWGRNFTSKCGFAVKIHNKYWMSVFVDRRLAVTDLGQRRKILA
jgi:hypothetical protein